MTTMHEQTPPTNNPETPRDPAQRFNPYIVPKGGSVEIDPDHTLYPKDYVMRMVGIDMPVVAGLTLAPRPAGTHDEQDEKQFFILDARGTTTNADFLLVDEGADPTTMKGIKGIREGQEVVLGRTELTDRFTFSDAVSRKHASVTFEEGVLKVADLNSKNGTTVFGFVYEDKKDQDKSGLLQAIARGAIVAEMTEEAGFFAQRMGHSVGEGDKEAPHGYFLNHPIVGRNSTSVRNGVYYTGGSEVALVDDRSSLMQSVTRSFEHALLGVVNQKGSITKDEILQAALDQTASILKYDLEKTERLSMPHFGRNNKIGTIIPLSEYVKKGVGVCRHQALLSAHFLETAIEKGLLKGSIAVERNHDLEVGGAHAWAVFKQPGVKDIIIDPAQGFIGTREQAANENRWRYILDRIQAT